MNNTGNIPKQDIQTNVLVYQQRGAVLLTSLLMLIIFTIIGLSGIQTTIIEEKMANNYRDRELAFQSAESALAFGESKVEAYFKENAYGTSGDDAVLWKNYLLKDTTIHNCKSKQDGNLEGTCGPYEKDSGIITEFDPFAADAWNNAPAISGTNTTLTIRSSGSTSLQAPKYIIKLVRKDDSSGSYIFNIFAKGWGSDTNAVVILRSTYIKK